MSGLELAHPDDVDVLRAAIIDGRAQPDERATPKRGCCHRDGTWRWFDVIITDLSADPSVGGLGRQPPRRHRTQGAGGRAQRSAGSVPPRVRRRADRHRSRRPRRAHPAREPLDGRAARPNAGRARGSLDPRPDASRRSRRERRPPRAPRPATRSTSTGIEKRYLRPDGSTVWASLSVSLVRDMDGQPMYQIGQLEDITDRKVLADRLAYDAAHDSMTGLLNRSSFTDRVSAALAADHATARSRCCSSTSTTSRS